MDEVKMNEIQEKLKVQIDELPMTPGCYIYENKFGDIIYIGKSKCIKKRVKQYFSFADKREKIKALVKEIANIRTEETSTELYALLRECELIKKYKPKYNSMLKREKKFPYLKIDITKEYPSFSMCDSLADDGAFYFGCFYNEYDFVDTLGLIASVWNVPVCGKADLSKERLCLYYNMGKCDGPCAKQIDSETYRKKVLIVIKFLQGNESTTIRNLKKDMKLKADNLEFEVALSLREKIFELEKLKKRARKFNTALEGKNMFVFVRAYNADCFSIFYISDAVLKANCDFSNLEELDNDILNKFINNVVEGKEENSFIDGKKFSRFIIEIGADKLFLERPKSSKPDDLVKLIKRKQKEFIS